MSGPAATGAPGEGDTTSRLAGLQIMLVEDEYLIAADLCDTIARHGGAVVGPAPDVAQARALLATSRVHGAILDLKLAGETSLPLIDELVARGTPVILVTGYSVSHIPAPYDRLPSLTKPLNEAALLALIEARFRS